MNWQLIGLSSASAFCGLLFAIFLGRTALAALWRLTEWVRACPIRAAVLMPLVGLLVAYAGTKPPTPPEPTAKAVLGNGGKTLRFVYDEADYGAKGTNWFSVAEAEAIDPYSEDVPWHGSAGTVTKVVFDRSFADYRPAQCGKWLFYFLELETIENIGYLDTSAATSLTGLFRGCRSLAAIDMSGFDTANVTDTSGMFAGCSSLVTIYASDKFVTTAVTASSDMFSDCFSLVGGAGTGYDSFNPSDKTYARIDCGRMSDSPGYFTSGRMTIAAGAYASLDLVDDLGIEIPPDVDCARGDKVTIKAEGLAKGLKLAQDGTSGAWIVSGVPTEEIDFETRPMYARVTVTYKDKTKGDKGKVETLQPIVLSIAMPDPAMLAEGVLNEAYEPADIAALWPEVADAKINPREWSFKGWPAGVKYANGVVSGLPAKAGEFPVTATHKRKLADGKATVRETFPAVLTVWGDDGRTEFRYEDQAYGAAVDRTIADAKSVSGLPTGLKFKNGQVTGTPTKPGVFAVRVTKTDGSKETSLWKVSPGENPGLGAAAIGWAASKVKYDDGTKKATVLQGLSADFAVDASALAADAKVAVSGLPAGLKYDARTGKITGVATKAKSKVVTVRVVQNGVTVTQRFAIDVAANPFAGTYYAHLTEGSVREAATAVVTPAVGGSVKAVLDEYVPSRRKTAKASVSAKGFTMLEAYDPSDPNAVQIAYDFELKADARNNPDYAGGARTLQLVFARKETDEGPVVSFGRFALTIGADGTCWGWAQKALTAAECADEVAALGFAPQQVLTGVFSNGTEQVLYASAVLDGKKPQYRVKGKLSDGTAVKALLPLTYACFEKAFYSAPCLLTEKGGAQQAHALAFAAAASVSAAKLWSCETAAVLQPCSAFAADDIPGTAAEQMAADEMKLEAEGFPGFLIVVDDPSADRAKAKLNVYAPSAKEGDRPLKTLSPAKLTAGAGYVFKCSFKWDAKVGGDGATYSFELVPSNISVSTPFAGRCEVKPVKDAAVVVGASMSAIERPEP